mgnify:CR=1 FL=1
MILIVYGKHFLKSVKALPLLEQKRLSKLLEIMAIDPFDGRLHAKKLSGPLTGLFSFRIGRDWRVLFQFLNARTVQLTDIGNRK